MPLGTGMLFTRHPRALRAAFTTDSPYMPSRRAGSVASGTLGTLDDSHEVSLPWSRRAAGLPLFVWLATVGAPGAAAVIDRCAALGAALAESLVRAGFVLATRSALPVVCFTHPDIEAGRLTCGDVARRVVRSGAAWISPVRLSDGRTVLRACVSSHRTTEAHVQRLVRALVCALQSASRATRTRHARPFPVRTPDRDQSSGRPSS
jgi:glutamate/tyrosine decarboxylase-like PLP-dependent enzyme